jgi:hypothetical protein
VHQLVTRIFGPVELVQVVHRPAEVVQIRRAAEPRA